MFLICSECGTTTIEHTLPMQVALLSGSIRKLCESHPKTNGCVVPFFVSYKNLSKVGAFMKSFVDVEDYLVEQIEPLECIGSIQLKTIAELCIVTNNHLAWHQALTAKKRSELTDDDIQVSHLLNELKITVSVELVEFIDAVVALSQATSIKQIPASVSDLFMPYYTKIFQCFHGRLIINYVNALKKNEYNRMHAMFESFNKWCIPFPNESYFEDLISLCDLTNNTCLESLEMYMRHLRKLRKLSLDFGFSLALAIRFACTKHKIVFTWAQYLVNTAEFAPIHPAINTLHIYTQPQPPAETASTAEVAPAVVIDSDTATVLKVHPVPSKPVDDKKKRSFSIDTMCKTIVKAISVSSKSSGTPSKSSGVVAGAVAEESTPPAKVESIDVYDVLKSDVKCNRVRRLSIDGPCRRPIKDRLHTTVTTDILKKSILLLDKTRVIPSLKSH
jgi:hypothetical protein